MNPEYPVYIVSKGRWESRLTSKVLERMAVPYRIVVEPQELEQYSAVIDPSRILVLPFSNLGLGSVPARNWIWEHSRSLGAERHWILDDNIHWFARLHDNKKILVDSGTCFRIVEEFVDRYENIALAGLQYEMFLPALQKNKPYQFNTRIYSCILIKNDIPYRWRGRYNEDTDLSLRVLKDGWVTFLIQQFMCKKITTMHMKGGNTESLYKLDNADGRLLMAQSLQRQHPDVVKITRKWGRWQHLVNYKPFRGNKPIRKPGIDVPPGTNEFGLALVETNGRE